jgi:hypothetical protein
MILHLKAKPNARENKIAHAADGSLHVRVKASAQDGKANGELVRFLSEILDLPKSRVRILSGFNSPFKKLEIGADEDYVRGKLK